MTTGAQRVKKWRALNPEKRKKYDKARQPKNTSRKRARRKVEKALGKSRVKGKDVHHVDGNPKNNSRKNLRVVKRYHAH